MWNSSLSPSACHSPQKYGFTLSEVKGGHRPTLEKVGESALRGHLRLYSDSRTIKDVLPLGSTVFCILPSSRPSRHLPEEVESNVWGHH